MTDKTAIGKYLGKLFSDVSDGRVAASISIHNLRNIYIFSIVTCVLDSVSLVFYSAMNWNKFRFWHTFFNVLCCVAACVFVSVKSDSFIRRYKRDGSISTVRVNLLVTFFYIIMSAWSIMVDAEHYLTGEQMLTFYIVQFCFVCFVVMKPVIGSILITASFSALYIFTYLADGAVNMQPQNFFIFAAIAVFGNLMQHMLLQESEKSKADIIELNQILRQEAMVDDLTKLKNRNALRSDSDRHAGKSVYTIMADVDHFKSYNDTYGHVTGDTVLRLVASATMEAFSDGEVYRYGGDELLIILDDCTDSEIENKISSWKEALGAIRIPDATISVSCSYGCEKRFLKSADDLRIAIKLADDKLYEAKKAR